MERSTSVAPVAPKAEPRTRDRRYANGEGGINHEIVRDLTTGKVLVDRWRGALTVGYTPDGKQIRKVVTGKRKADVIAKLAELRTSANEGTTPARAELTIRRFLDSWLTDVLPGQVRPLTLQNYRDVSKRYIVPHIGQKRLRTLSPTDVTKMLRTLELGAKDRDPVSPNTRRLARSVLRRSLRWAMQEGLVTRNVAAIADGVNVGRSKARSLSPEDARQLLDTASTDRLEAAFAVALALGLRRGELLGLAWSDIELDKAPATLNVRRALKRIPGVGLVLDDPKTEESTRVVHLPTRLVEILRRHRRRQLEERLAAGQLWEPSPLGADLVFRTPQGLAMDPANFCHACYRVTEHAGIGRYSPHELRHSAASLLLAAGVELKFISELLGHSSIRITADIYTKVSDIGKASTATAMDTALWGTA